VRGVSSERTKDVLHFKKNRGEKIGGAIPYGWQLKRDGVHLEPNA
jgi:hypothetical protein